MSGVKDCLCHTRDEWELKMKMIQEMAGKERVYMPLQLTSETYELGLMFPPLLAAKLLSRLNLVIHLDTEKPILEVKWVKTGDIHEWVRSTSG